MLKWAKIKKTPQRKKIKIKSKIKYSLKLKINIKFFLKIFPSLDYPHTFFYLFLID
jgi:hypothetical protein